MHGVAPMANQSDRLKKKNERRHDAWANPTSGKGTQADKSRGTVYTIGRILSPQMLSLLYQHDWLARKVCEKPAKDATRRGVVFAEKSNEKLLKEAEKLLLFPKITEGIAWGRLYGGSALIFVVDDGTDGSVPLDYTKVTRIVDIMSIDRNFLSAEGIDVDPLSTTYGMPSHYRVNGGSLFHASRIAMFRGAKATYDKRMENNGWGTSYVQLYWDAISDFQSSMGDLRHIMTESSLGVLKVPGLTNAKAMGGNAINAVMNRAEVFNRYKSIYRTAVLDSEEDYSYVNRTLSGLAELADRFMTQVAGAVDLPELILFGTSPGGLNASQEEQMETYYDSVSAIQETEATPAINMFLGCVTRGQDITWDYKPLNQLSDTKKAEVRNKEAQTLVAVADLLALGPEECRAFLNQTGHFQIDDINDGDLSDDELINDEADPNEPTGSSEDDQAQGG